MELFRFESKKMLIHQKGLLILLAFMAAAVAFWVITDSPAAPDMELYRASYEKELPQVEGALTQEKRNWIENAFSESFRAKQQLPQLYQAYYAGSLSKEEFEAQKATLQESAARYQGLNVLYDQYMYVRGSESDRWLIYTNGWDALLSRDAPNLFFIAALVLLLIPLLCGEYGCGMDQLLLSTGCGSSVMGRQKCVLAILLAAGLSLAFDLLRLAFCALKYGLPCPNAPIQSLQTFENCIFDVSLGNALVIILYVRMAGAVFLASFILAAAALTRNYAPACLTVFSTLLLPWLGLPDTLQYRLPIPLGWLRASGIFRGDKAASSTGEELLFRHLAPNELLSHIAAACLLTALFLAIVLKRGRNAMAPFGRAGRIFRFLPLLMVFLLSACGYSADVSAASLPFNSCQAASFCGDGFTVNADSGTGIVVKFSDGREESLLRSPFRGTQDILPAIYGTQDSVICLVSYMVPEDLVRLSERKNRTIYRLVRVDLSSFDETVLFEAEASMENKWAFLNEATAFFLDEKNIYFILPQEIRQVDRRTRTVTALDIPTNQNVAFDGKKIFYLNEACCLTSYDPATGNTEVWEDVAAGAFVLEPGGVSYTDLRKGGRRCFYPLAVA